MANNNPGYPNLINKPMINGIELNGNVTSQQLGIPEAQAMTITEIDNALGW